MKTATHGIPTALPQAPPGVERATTARAHTERMLAWWADAGIARIDLAVRRGDGAMLWHRDLRLLDVPLSWARAENARGADVYARPTREQPCALAFLDDVRESIALRTAAKYSALVVRTSPAGGCHLWLRSTIPLEERERAWVQRWLATRIGADLRSCSGEHLGRLAGFKNWKRGGPWVNVRAASTGVAWNPDAALRCTLASRTVAEEPMRAHGYAVVDRSESGQEWAWIMALLEAGVDAGEVFLRLRDHALPRRGTDAARYARITVERAVARAASRDGRRMATHGRG